MNISTRIRSPHFSRNPSSGTPRQTYAQLLECEIERAIRQQSLDGTGAGSLVAWARSNDGRSVLAWAGIVPNERALELIKQEVVEKAKRGKIDLFGKRRGDVSHQTVRTV